MRATCRAVFDVIQSCRQWQVWVTTGWPVGQAWGGPGKRDRGRARERWGVVGCLSIKCHRCSIALVFPQPRPVALVLLLVLPFSCDVFVFFLLGCLFALLCLAMAYHLTTTTRPPLVPILYVCPLPPPLPLLVLVVVVLVLSGVWPPYLCTCRIALHTWRGSQMIMLSSNVTSRKKDTSSRSRSRSRRNCSSIKRTLQTPSFNRKKTLLPSANCAGISNKISQRSLTGKWHLLFASQNATQETVSCSL